MKLATLLLFAATANADELLITDDNVFGEVHKPTYVDIIEVPLVGRFDGFGLRLADSRKNFDGLSQESLFINISTPWGWSTRRYTSTTLRFVLDVGQFQEQRTRRSFVSFGPSFRLSDNRWRSSLFVDFGLSPTIIDGTKYGDEKLGTSFNFTSYIGVGVMVGKNKQSEIKLRYQHISNGGISETNPGVDMVGVDYVFRMSH